jgi:NADH:ubiquinone oxidoreductase subunit 2 (subunit N)
VQAAVTQRTVMTLRAYSIVALAGLCLVSLLAGWWVSGWVLRLIGATTQTGLLH